MVSQALAQETELQQSTDAIETDIESLENSATGETQEVVGIAGEEHVTGVFPPFDVTTFPSQILWLAITFGALYFIMSRMALPRIGEILEVRRDRIEGDLAEADRLRQKTDQAIASYEAALNEARSKAHTIAEETRSEIKADLEAKRKKVEADLAKKMNAAEARIAETKSEALSHVDEIAAETTQAVVAQLLTQPQIETARDAVAKVSKD